MTTCLVSAEVRHQPRTLFEYQMPHGLRDPGPTKAARLHVMTTACGLPGQAIVMTQGFELDLATHHRQWRASCFPCAACSGATSDPRDLADPCAAPLR